MSNLLFFYGEECPHCKKMEVHVSELENKNGVKVNRIEVWHSEDNIARMESLDKEPCGGVPFFFNEETKEAICGEASYEDLKKWAGC